jgi:hypothetical protein
MQVGGRAVDKQGRPVDWCRWIEMRHDPGLRREQIIWPGYPETRNAFDGPHDQR